MSTITGESAWFGPSVPGELLCRMKRGRGHRKRLRAALTGNREGDTIDVDLIRTKGRIADSCRNNPDLQCSLLGFLTSIQIEFVSTRPSHALKGNLLTSSSLPMRGLPSPGSWNPRELYSPFTKYLPGIRSCGYSLGSMSTSLR